MRYGNEEEQSRKLFIGGISLDTTDDGMRDYFAKYGNITDCVVIRDQSSKRSKGFGFVTFETEEEADKCMADRPHSLDGRSIDAKRAVSREESSKPGAHVQVKKVFVGGVKQGCDESMLREYFGKYGSIVSIEIPPDRNTGLSKGFAFVTFDDFDVTDKLVAKRHHDVGGFRCEVKKALSREEMEKAKQQVEMKQRSGPPRGGSRGGGRGRRGGAGGDGYGSYGGGGGPMRGQYGQSQRSGGPYGGGYGSGGSGGYGSAGGGSGGYGSGGYGSTGGSGGYGSGAGGYGGSGGGYGGGGYGSGGYGSYGGGTDNYSGYGGSGYGQSYTDDSYKGYGGSNNGYGGQGNGYYGDTGAKY